MLLNSSPFCHKPVRNLHLIASLGLSNESPVRSTDFRDPESATGWVTVGKFLGVNERAWESVISQFSQTDVISDWVHHITGHEELQVPENVHCQERKGTMKKDYPGKKSFWKGSPMWIINGNIPGIFSQLVKSHLYKYQIPSFWNMTISTRQKSDKQQFWILRKSLTLVHYWILEWQCGERRIKARIIRQK